MFGGGSNTEVAPGIDKVQDMRRRWERKQKGRLRITAISRLEENKDFPGHDTIENLRPEDGIAMIRSRRNHEDK